MVTREKNGDGEIRGKAIEARRGEAARASAAVARVGRAPDGAARARALGFDAGKESSARN